MGHNFLIFILPPAYSVDFEKGALTEQYILQQLISDVRCTPCYYSAENSRCEVNFLLQSETGFLPPEVKAEENLRAKSLNPYFPDLTDAPR